MKYERVKPFLWAALMGGLTMFFCLYVADGIFNAHMNHYPWWRQILPRQDSTIIFFVFIIGLPLLFRKKVRWRHTIVNLPLYYYLYILIYNICGLNHGYFLLNSGGFISFGPEVNGAIVAPIFWGIQSFVYLGCAMENYMEQK